MHPGASRETGISSQKSKEVPQAVLISVPCLVTVGPTLNSAERTFLHEELAEPRLTDAGTVDVGKPLRLVIAELDLGEQGG